MNRVFSARIGVTVLWAVTFAIYFMVRMGLDLGQPWEGVAKLLPEAVLLLSVMTCRRTIAQSDGGCASLTVLPVCLALVFSMLGDTAGEFKGTRCGDIAFALQIAFFIFAHVCYMCCWFRRVDFGRRWSPWKPWGFACAGIILAYMLVVGVKVFGSIDSAVFALACSAYMVALIGLGVASVQQNRVSRACAVPGAMLFIFSDSIIALDVFVFPVPHSGALIMTTYFAAQYLLNISLIPSARH